MNYRIVFSLSLLALLTFVMAQPTFADPPVSSAPVIDGTIGADWVDSAILYPNGTLLVADPDDDSAWGPDNELKNVYINWDANNLYLAIDYTINDNGLLVYLDFDTPDGITNFYGPDGYLGAWPRNITFPATNGIDAFYGAWWGANGNFYVANGSNNSTDVTAQCDVATGNQGGTAYHTEIRCPWTVFGYTIPIYPTGGDPAIPQINILTAIMGGDNWNSPDVAPNGVAAPGDGSQMNVQANHFAVVGIGPTAVTLQSLTAVTAIPTSFLLIALLLAGAMALLTAVALRRRIVH